jgi:hypothetical protein
VAGRPGPVDDFEAALEGTLLGARLKEHLTGPQVEEYLGL